MKIEDHVPLDETFVPNPNTWCSVCASPKHFAHNCLQAVNYMGGHLPKVRISSYLPWYKIDPDAPKIVNSAEYSMMSFAENFSFNWSSAVTENCTGFYNRFKEATGIMAEEISKTVESELESVRMSHNTQADDSGEGVLVIDEDREDVEDSGSEKTTLNNFSFTKEMEKIDQDQRGFQLHLEESQTEIGRVAPVVFEDKRKDLEKTAERMGVTVDDIINVRSIKFPIENEQEMDFIPLGDWPEPSVSPNLVQHASVNQIQEEKTEAKVFLTKEHSKILLNHGDDFLQESREKFDLQLRLVWESVGNMLVMYGLPLKQTAFYNELLDFMKPITREEHSKNRNNAFTMPKSRDKLMNFITDHLRRLKDEKRSFNNLREMIKKMERQVSQQEFKSADKIRRQLNTFFFGKIGLREGKTHLIGMIKKYQTLKEGGAGCDSIEFREELRQHFLYLFTAYDHENYAELMSDYEECCQSGRWHIPLKALRDVQNMVNFANGSLEEAPSTSRNDAQNDSLLFYEDPVGERFEIVSAVGHTDDPIPRNSVAVASEDVKHEDLAMEVTESDTENFVETTNVCDNLASEGDKSPEKVSVQDNNQSQNSKHTPKKQNLSKAPSSDTSQTSNDEKVTSSDSSNVQSGVDAKTPSRVVTPKTQSSFDTKAPSSVVSKTSSDVTLKATSTVSVSKTQSDVSQKTSSGGSPKASSSATPKTPLKVNSKKSSEVTPKATSSVVAQKTPSTVITPRTQSGVNSKAPSTVTTPKTNVVSKTPSSVETKVSSNVLPRATSSVVTPKTQSNVTQKAPSTITSPNYSELSLKIISEAMSMFSMMNNQNAIAKLKLVEQKANKNQITEEDYQSLLHIQTIVQSKIASKPSSS